MRTRSWFVALTLAGGCSGSSDPPPPTETARGGGANAAPTGYQCAVGPRLAVAPRDVTGSVGDAPAWFVGGPSGVRAYALLAASELRWNDGRRSVPVRSALALRDGLFAWTGRRYLVVASELVTTPDADGYAQGSEWRNHRVLTTDATHDDVRAVRAPLPANACDVRVTETGGGALVTWFRRGPEGCDAGEAWALAVDPDGQVRGGARALTYAGAPVRVQSLSARWDFGRAVVTGRGDRTHTWVLDASGDTVATEATGDIACPRAGCARVRVEAERSDPGGDEGGAAALRFEPLGAERFGARRGFAVQLRRPTVRGFAVSGDLLLVLHTPQGGGCDLSILDLEQRTVVAEHHEDSTRACEERHARALPRGFALAGFERPAGAFSVTFDCTRPTR